MAEKAQQFDVPDQPQSPTTLFEFQLMVGMLSLNPSIFHVVPESVEY